MNENDQLMTTHVTLGSGRKRVKQNPNIRNTPEWHAWEAGYSAARQDTGRLFAERMR